jgi:hypothetical protein
VGEVFDRTRIAGEPTPNKFLIGKFHGTDCTLKIHADRGLGHVERVNIACR